MARQLRAEVLLVEDNAVNQKVALMMLKHCGCRVDIASNGLAALGMVDARTYDIIFMDCEMPEMDGLQATAAIRGRSDAKANVPIIAFTALAVSGDRQRCLNAGMNAYVTKPVQLDDFQGAIERWVPNSAAPAVSSSLSLPDSTHQGQSDATPALDLQVMSELRALAESTDRALLHQILESFSADAEARILALSRAAGTPDAPMLRETAHALKGASAHIGARGMATLSQALETLGATGSVVGADELVRGLRAEFDRVKRELPLHLRAADE